jgi:hypothetical protein
MAVAIVLSLIFRIGTKQRDSLKWSAPADAANMIAFLQDTAQRWTVPRKTVDAAAVEIGDVIARLEKLGRLDAGGELRLSTDGLDFTVDIRCHGTLLLPLPRESAPLLPHYAIGSEEGVVLAAYAPSSTASPPRASRWCSTGTRPASFSLTGYERHQPLMRS